MKKAVALLIAILMLVPAAFAENKTRTVTDGYGREVEIPAVVHTIAATAYSARLLTYAGVQNKLVGVTDMDMTGDVGMPYSAVNADLFKTLTPVGAGGANDTPYYETLTVLAPDVIFCDGDVEMVENIQAKTGIPVIGLSYTGIFDESVYASLSLIGEVMGATVRTDEVIGALRGWQQDLDACTKDIADADKPTVYTGGVSFRGAHGFEGTYGEYPPFLAIHAQNVVDETEQSGALLIDLEKVIEWDPDIIFLNPNNMNLVNEDYQKNPAFYDALSAVQNGQVYAQISYNYNSTNIEVAVADAYYAGKVIYPEQFQDVDPVAKADEIFALMLGQLFYTQLKDSGQEFGILKIGE